MQQNLLAKRNTNKPGHNILKFIINHRLKPKNTTKEIAEAIATIELEQAIYTMLNGGNR